MTPITPEDLSLLKKLAEEASVIASGWEPYRFILVKVEILRALAAGSSALLAEVERLREEREIVPVWPSQGEVAKAGWAWRNDKERETDSDDQRYFEHNWHSLPGLGEYVTAEIRKRPEFQTRASKSAFPGEPGLGRSHD